MATRGNRPKDPADTKGGVRGTHGLGDAPREPSAPEGAESSGEEREFELSNAMSPPESSDERAAKREHDASEAKAAGDAAEAYDAKEKKDRNLATEVVPGPGPKDAGAGRATKKHLETHRLEPQRRH